MKRLLLGLVLAGCSLNADYVRQDRNNYETLAPVVRRYIEDTSIYPPEKEDDILDRLEAWDAWSSAGMRSINERED